MQNIGEKFVSLLKKYGKKLVKNEKDSGGMYTSGINAAHQEKDAQFQKYHTDTWMLNAKKERLWSCDIYSADENQKLYNFAIGLRICTSKDCLEICSYDIDKGCHRIILLNFANHISCYAVI